MEPKTIFLIGEVSCGKSSLLNALANGLISCTSLQRETFNPTLYHISKKGTYENIITLKDKLESQHNENEKMRENINNIEKKYIIDK